MAEDVCWGVEHGISRSRASSSAPCNAAPLGSGKRAVGHASVTCRPKGSSIKSRAANNRPATTKVIDCGRGFDRALVGPEDIIEDCERRSTNQRSFLESIPKYYFEPPERVPDPR